MGLSGESVLVTGGARNIGRAIALAVARAGAATVIVNHLRNTEAAAETCAQIQALGVSAEAITADVGNPREVQALFKSIRSRHSRLGAIVHAAAMGRFQTLLEARPAEWDLALRTNAHSLLLIVREALELLAQPGGRIVALSSLGSQRYVPFYGAIGPSKAALESVVRGLAVELSPRGIGVNAVAGGMIESETLRRFPQHEALREAIVQRTPLGRLGTAEELADVVIFLCTDAARWISGQTIVADGGFGLL